MALSNILREFLIRIGYDTDEASRKAFLKGVEGATEVVVGLGAAIEATAATVIAGLAKMSDSMERFYFISQRTGASVANIKSIGFAAEQMGISAEAGYSALESLASFIRSSPQAMQFLSGTMGINVQGKDTAQLLTEIGKRFAQMPVWMANAYARVLGINENTMLAMRRGMGEYLTSYQDILKKVGVDEQAAANASHKFMVQLRTTVALIEVFSDKVVQLVAGKAGDYIARFRKAVEDNFTRISQVTSDIILWVLRAADVVTVFAVRGVQLISTFYDWFMKLPAPIREVSEAISALGAALWLLGPTKLLVSLLAGALLLLYDDYKTWKEGGKHLIDWQTWQDDYNKAKPIIDKLAKDFTSELNENWKLFSEAFKVYMRAIVDGATWAWHELSIIFDKFKELNTWLDNTWIGRFMKRRQEYLQQQGGYNPSAGEDQDALPDAYGTPRLPGSSVWPSPGDYPPGPAMKITDWASLIKKVVGIESGGNPNAVSPKGAHGLMQIIPSTFDEISKKLGLNGSMDDPVTNLKVGIEYLRELAVKYGGDLAKTLAAYNWGPGNLDKDLAMNGANWMHHLPNETANYLVKAGAASRGDVNIEQSNTYHIHGADPTSTKHAVGAAQDASNARLVRNLTPTAY